ncbi:MAG: radical SAM protein [Lepagella sp.]
MYIGLSPAYSVRNEASASFLIRVDKIINKVISGYSTFCIPPFMGYILSHISDDEYPQSVENISKALKVSSEAIEKFVQQIIDADANKKFIVSDTQYIILPSDLLIQCSEKPYPLIYEEDDFDGLGDFVVTRPSVPTNANLMVTTKCTTDCLYCYANRKINPDMKTEKILDLVRELHDQGTINVTLTGGDIFAHPDWREILKCVREYGYQPFLSTKTPINYEQIQYLKDLGYEEIQFSLDSDDPNILKKLIRVNNGYLDKVASFLTHCSELKLKVLVRSVLTKLNASKERITSLYSFLSKYDCVKEWVMTPAFFSEYKRSEYKSLEINNDDMIWVYQFSQREDLPFKIGLNKISKDGYALKRFDNTEEYVCYNQICLANTIGISILANGLCSVCEMLYENPEYVLGDVNKSTVKEIWNSEKALDLYHMKQQHVPQSSPCSECAVFEKCRNGFGKRICYLDIAKIGHSKFEPDPRCPHSENIDLVL